MARSKQKLALDGEGYEIQMLPATEGLAVYNRLLKVLGPMMRSALKEPGIVGGKKVAADGASEDSTAGMKIAAIVIEGFETMDVAFTLELAALFAKNTSVMMEGAMVPMAAGDIFDQHFAGRYAHMTRWLLAHLKLNFSDFLAGLGSSVAPKVAG